MTKSCFQDEEAGSSQSHWRFCLFVVTDWIIQIWKPAHFNQIKSLFYFFLKLALPSLLEWWLGSFSASASCHTHEWQENNRVAVNLSVRFCHTFCANTSGSMTGRVREYSHLICLMKMGKSTLNSTFQGNLANCCQNVFFLQVQHEEEKKYINHTCAQNLLSSWFLIGCFFCSLSSPLLNCRIRVFCWINYMTASR